MRSLLRTATTLLCAGGIVISGAAAAQAATTYRAVSSMSVNGTKVTATTTLSASSATTAEYAGVCARGPQGQNVDFTPRRTTRLTSTGIKITASQTLTAGRYTYFACLRVNGKWTNVGNVGAFTIAKTTSTTPTDPASTPAPAPTPTAPVTGSGSTSAMPSGTLSGWQQVWAQDFTTTAAAGSFRSTYPDIGDYGDGGKDTSGNGCYNNGANVSAHDGLADLQLRSVNGCPSGAVLVANNWGAQTYGRYTIRYRADAAVGYGAAFLLWPASDDWSDGEIDFPESSFTGKQYMAAFQPGSPGTIAYKNQTTASWQDWHTATTEWTPGLLVFLIDGEEVGRTTKGVPTTPFKWIVQTATDGLSTPSSSVNGHLLIDWMVASRRA